MDNIKQALLDFNITKINNENNIFKIYIGVIHKQLITTTIAGFICLDSLRN